MGVLGLGLAACTKAQPSQDDAKSDDSANSAGTTPAPNPSQTPPSQDPGWQSDPARVERDDTPGVEDLPPGPPVVRIEGSVMLLNPRDRTVSASLYLFQEWEPTETQLFRDQIEPGDVVVDLGANIGYYTLLAARLVGDEGHVYAFEPDPESFSILARNVELNGYENVTLVNEAAGAKKDTIRLYLNGDNRGDHRVYDPGDGRRSIEVPVVPLDTYFADHKGDIDFVKMDTQGAECAILEGMRGLLDAHPEMALVLEYTPSFIAGMGYDPKACLEDMVERGFRIAELLEDEGKIVPADLEAFGELDDDENGFTNLFLPSRRN